MLYIVRKQKENKEVNELASIQFYQRMYVKLKKKCTHPSDEVPGDLRQFSNFQLFGRVLPIVVF